MKSKTFKRLWRCKQIRPLLWLWFPNFSRYMTIQEMGENFRAGFIAGLKAGGASDT